MTTLLHLCTPADWRSALSTGAMAPPSMTEVGFVHLSTPEQVELPANRLFAGRRDMVLLAVDTDLLDGVEIRWEPGVPGDPESMRFPHAYGAVPTRAVRAVLPYRPDGGGRFTAPTVPELDDATRARLVEASLLRRAATREVEVTGGIAVLTDPVPVSRMHNQLVVDGPVDAGAVGSESDRVLGGAGLSDGAAYVVHPGPADAENLRAAGWSVEELTTMSLRVEDFRGDAPDGAVPDGAPAATEVGLDDLRPLYDAGWREQFPTLGENRIAQLTERHRIEDAVVDVRCFAAYADDRVVAACLLKCDGGTALLDAVETLPDARGRGHAAAVVRAAVASARSAGCDLVVLDCWTDDWPRTWYARLGFRDVGPALAATRT